MSTALSIICFPQPLVSEDGLSLQSPPSEESRVKQFDRACVGKSMADASTWIALVSMLSVFHITKAKDAAGNDIEVPESYGDGIVSPRSDAARQLILDTPPMELDSNPMFYD
ncbi:hypothetical protein H2248_005016 [Termitomyces sp. 'cryptogamus']|nr:hypothetical protein H2248_005016 [Termitomyces sp. 'cryptogamus']